MEFMITCPVDGSIEVSLEDVETVVLREPEQAEVIFRCPECGTEVSVFVRIPSFLLAAIEAMAEDGGGQMAPLAGIVALSSDTLDTDEIVSELEGTDDDRIDAYCEYFRRQLADVESVEDALAELGCDEEE
jgi:predicted RNA-binding Zn-ribbon protein involved in translation (DUF1610 family)